jgi:hypothetical protein
VTIELAKLLLFHCLAAGVILFDAGLFSTLLKWLTVG